MDYGSQLAQIIAKNENKKRIGVVVGQVISISPVKVSVLNGTVVLIPDQLYINSSLVLNVGDLVKVTPAEGEQTWFVDYKVGG